MSNQINEWIEKIEEAAPDHVYKTAFAVGYLRAELRSFFNGSSTKEEFKALIEKQAKEGIKR